MTARAFEAQLSKHITFPDVPSQSLKFFKHFSYFLKKFKLNLTFPHYVSSQILFIYNGSEISKFQIWDL